MWSCVLTCGRCSVDLSTCLCSSCSNSEQLCERKTLSPKVWGPVSESVLSHDPQNVACVSQILFSCW